MTNLSDDHSLQFLRELRAHPKQVIDLTLDDDDISQVSWLSITPTTQYHVNLTPLSLIDRFPTIEPSEECPSVVPVARIPPEIPETSPVSFEDMQREKAANLVERAQMGRIHTYRIESASFQSLFHI